MQHEIAEPTDLLDAKGHVLQPGWARRALVRYNRDAIRANPFALKEWDFYQLRQGDWVLQLTIGHVSYAASISASAFHLRTGQQAGFSHLKPLPLRRLPLPRDPEGPSSVAVGGRGYSSSFVVTAGERRLAVHDEASGTHVDVALPNDPANEKLVIATPFANPTRFYLNCKENFWGGSGSVRLGDVAFELDGTTTTTLDWGRGVWPFTQEWFWGNATAFVGGRRVGWNIGWGFGDLSHATENVVFADGVATKLGEVRLDHDPADLMKPWHFTSDDGAFDVVMTPVHDHDTATKILGIVDTRCHQVWGTYSGTVPLASGEVLTLDDVVAFCEHAVNRW
jgi:hypothetical protein